MDEKLKKTLAEEGAELVDLFGGIKGEEETHTIKREENVDYSKITVMEFESYEALKRLNEGLLHVMSYWNNKCKVGGRYNVYYNLKTLARLYGINTLAAIVNALIRKEGKDKVLRCDSISAILSDLDILRDWETW